MSDLLHARYRLVRTIAGGGMAQVYDARLLGEHRFERRVAIKRVLPELLDDTSVRRMFMDEARIASRLHHGNIVQVIDYGTIDGAEFLAMEFVDGIDARKAVRQAAARGTAMPIGVALHLVTEVAHALDYLHRLTDETGAPLGIVHRDVTPHNVLLSWEGDVKLSDFGIALALDRDQRTATGIVKGKNGFIAPEQMMGRNVTGAADVFALGATLHTLLAQQSPWDETTPAVAPAQRISPDLPEEIVALLQDCMALDPAARPDARTVANRAAALQPRWIDGDGRSALREWLAPLREQAAAPHALDDLMRLALVPVSPGDQRTLRVQAVAPEHTPTPVLANVLPSSNRRRWWLAGAVGGVLVIAAAGTRLATHGSSPTTYDEPTTPASATVEALAPSPPTIAELPARPEPAPPIPEAPRARPAARERPKVARARSTAAPPASGVGWLRVGGAKLLGARVSIDGKPAGHAPLEQVLPAGRHRVLVEDDNTPRPLVDVRVDVGTEHTRTQPQQILR